MKEVYVQLISDEGNNCVVRMPGRKEPGVVMQGDTLQQLAQDIDEILSLVEGRRFSELHDEVFALSERINEMLFWYKKALDESA